MDYYSREIETKKSDPEVLVLFRDIVHDTLTRGLYTHLYVTFGPPRRDRLTQEGYLRHLDRDAFPATMEMAKAAVDDVKLGCEVAWDWFASIWALTQADAPIYICAYVTRGYEPERPSTTEG
jgi:hypothetical protein